MKPTAAILVAGVAMVSVLITAFTVLAVLHVDTVGFVNFVQLMFAATTSIIGVFLVKRTGDAVATAQTAQDQVAAVSAQISDTHEQVAAVGEQVADVKSMVNGNTAQLIARVGPIVPQNDIVIPIPTGEDDEAI